MKHLFPPTTLSSRVTSKRDTGLVNLILLKHSAHNGTLHDGHDRLSHDFVDRNRRLPLPECSPLLPYGLARRLVIRTL